MIKGFIIAKNRKSVKSIGVIAGSENDDGSFKHEVIGYIGKVPAVIKTNLNQHQWDLFCEGKLLREELRKYI
ncbi:hypothetical protein HBE96_00310 [Clostridium sp. P21]|uniref:Uncharacterized protein n=1 Tax=Clostridium muellerianum TaxID=2716538 RepID=A0A7Y0HKQ7_9CLOT|nr:hypothetical protein [Clostridium muellerianum]NMM61169.1 hypothetical protein [Clostridium muellerianum]